MSTLLDMYTELFSKATPFLSAMVGGAEPEVVATDRVRSWSWKMPQSGMTLSLVVTDDSDEL